MSVSIQCDKDGSVVHGMSYICLVAAVLMGLAGAYAGTGLLLSRAFGLRVKSAGDVVLAAWMGWCLHIPILQVWHIFFPIDVRPLIFLLISGISGVLWNRSDLLGLLRARSAGRLTFWFVFAAMALWLASHTTAQAYHYDSGLYYLTSVRWASTHAVVPGLVNLHNRLAFNSSYFLYVAMLSIGPFTDKYHHLASGLMLLLLFGKILVSARQLFIVRKTATLSNVFDVVFMVPAVVLAVGGYEWRSSPSPDLAVYILGIGLGSELLRLFERIEGGSRAEVMSDESVRLGLQYSVFVIILMSLVGVTVKMGFLALGASAVFVAVGVFLVAGKGPAMARSRTIVWCMAAAIVTTVPWMTRGVILSGYVAYPCTFGSFPVEWRVSAESAVELACIIRNWARGADLTAGNMAWRWDWIWPWVNGLSRKPFETVTPLILPFIAGALLLVDNRKQRVTACRSRLPWLFLVVPTTGLVFWFFTAPGLRLAGSTFWLLGAGVLAIALRLTSRNLVISTLVCINVLLFAQNVNVFDFFREYGRSTEALPKGHVQEMKTTSGLSVFVPVEGDQCWDAPLPCTPYLNPQLRLRKPGDMSGGFVLDRSIHIADEEKP